MPLEGIRRTEQGSAAAHQGQFALYDVREDAAEQFKCENRLDASLISPKAATSKAFGKYYGAVFRLGRKNALNKRPSPPYGRAKAIAGS